MQVPASVSIPAGVVSAPFTATVLDDGAFDADEWVTVSAQASGYVSATAQVLVLNTDLPQLTLSLTTPQIVEGQSVIAILSSDTVFEQPVAVAIASSSPTALTGPASVTLPAHSNTVSFTLLAVDNTVIEPTHTYTVSASASGFLPASASLTVFDNDTPTLFLSLDRTNISEGDGPLAAVGTLTRQPVTDQPLTVALASTNRAAALVPAQITIPALQAQTSFYVAAVNADAVTGPKITSISAQCLDALGNPVGSLATETLVVQDDDGPTLKMLIANKVVPKGTNPATTATVSRNTPPTNDLVVTLTSSATNEATVPGTLTISAGTTNASFEVASLDDGVPNSSQSVLITAAATNFASGSDQLLVSDVGLPDLVITSISAPASALTQEPLLVSFRMVNQGLGPLTNAVTQNVYLATDPTWGSYVLVGTVTNFGSLSPGQYVDQSVLVPASALGSPGTNWVVVLADANGDSVEVNKANNTAVSTHPIVVSAEYTATVKAGLKNVVAGTPVLLSGIATMAVGGPAANKQVNILLTVRGLQRVLSVITDASGNFSTLFTPLLTEAGNYTVAAVAPGITSAPAQDQFTILGMTLNPASMVVSVAVGGQASGAVVLQNLGEVPLTGLTAAINGVAANLTATASLSPTLLPGQGNVTLTCTVAALDATILQSSFLVHIISAEGLALDLPVSASVQPMVARLVTQPPQLSATMTRASQTILQFDIINTGGAASGPLTVNVPNVSWLSLVSTNPLPSLGLGESNRVTVLLSPPADLPLGPYTGTLTVSDNGIGLALPFTFDAVSSARGSLLVRSVDEFTFFADGNPPLTNAAVTLIEPFSRSVVASGLTDTNGLFLVSDLAEGTYELDLTADKHAAFKGAAVVVASQTANVEAFLSRQTVQYTWTVVPTQIQDQTLITVTTEFEANVPASVVVPSPASLDLAPLDQPGKFMDVPLTLANYGLIAVHNVSISIGSHPLYQFELVTRNIGTLPAHGTVTVPMRITRLQPTSANALVRPMDAGGDIAELLCYIPFGINYLFSCGRYDIDNQIAIPVSNVAGNCPGGSPRNGGTTVTVTPNTSGNGGPNVNPPVVVPPSSGPQVPCDACMAKAAVECLVGFVPGAGDLASGFLCGYSVGAQSPEASEECITAAIGLAAEAVGGPIGGEIANVGSCVWGFLDCKCPSNKLSCAMQLLVSQPGSGGPSVSDISVGLGLSAQDPRDVYAARSYPALLWIETLLGDSDGRWLSPGSGGAFAAWFSGFSQAVQTNSSSGALISSAERATLLALPRPSTVSAADVEAALDRWNLTLTNWRAGVYSPTNAPVGGNTNFIDLYALGGIMVTVAQQYQASQAEGYSSPVAGFFAALSAAQNGAGGGVCGHVTLQLDQNAVLTRDAFKATLQLDNGSSDILMNVGISVVVRNQVGQDVTGLFGIAPPTLTGSLTAVDGTGMLVPTASGSAQWTLIPTLDAAPQAATNYLVSGTLSYTQNGVLITIPLAPVPITVQPNPQLYVKYFHQRDVFADDPYTPQIEPSVPYSLAVMVQNRGYGIARSFQITSAQPKIIDNEKGLLIDFKLIGTEVAGQEIWPSLTVNCEDITA